MPDPARRQALSATGAASLDLLEVDEWSVARDHGLTVSCGDVGAGAMRVGDPPRSLAPAVDPCAGA